MNKKEYWISRSKNILIGLSVIFLYFFISIYKGLPFKLLGIDTASLPNIAKEIYILASEVFLISIICIIYHKELEKAIEYLKKNNKKYFSKYLKYWIIGLIVMFTSNIIINSFYNQLSNNEEAIRGMFANTPIYVFISAVFLAPILEELTFRLTFKKIFNKKWLFIILSGLFFGYLHISTLDNYLELLYIIPYGTLGAVFAYMLEDSKNICVPIAFHFLHNGIFMSLQFFMTFLL